MHRANKARWRGPELSFAEVRSIIEKQPDCECDERKAGAYVACRFVRKTEVDDGRGGKTVRVRKTVPFSPQTYHHKIDAGTVAGWCEQLDLDPELFGLDDGW